MFEKVIVSSVSDGKAVVYSYRNISKIYTHGAYIHISNGTYAWQFKITTIVSIVII